MESPISARGGNDDHVNNRVADHRGHRGWAAGEIVKGYGFGLVGNIVVGIIGALIAGWLLPAVGFVLIGGIGAAVINAIIGAVILLLIVGLFKRA